MKAELTGKFWFSMLKILAGGSSANPFTLGHYTVLDGLRKASHSDQIIWIPTGERKDKRLLTNRHREAMTRLAIPPEWAITPPKVIVDYSDVYGENTPTFLWMRKLEFQYPGVVILSDAIEAVNINPDDGEKALNEMKSAGARISTSREFTSEKNQ